MMDPVTLLLLGVGTRLLGHLAEAGARSTVRWAQARWRSTPPAAADSRRCCGHAAEAADAPGVSPTPADASQFGGGR